MSTKKIKVFIAGHNGMVGSSILRQLSEYGDKLDIIFCEKKLLDLRSQEQTNNFFKAKNPDYVICAAGKVGGIYANDNLSAEFIYDNIMISSNIIQNCYQYKVSKLLYLGSSCIYPRDCNQPIKEEYLLNGTLEKTNEAYAIAKIAALKMCEYYNKQFNTKFITLMPTNLYGPGDNYHKENSHVIAAIIRKMHEAKVKNINEVILWGSGEPKREFMYVNDLSKFISNIMFDNPKIFNEILSYDTPIINVGSAQEYKISELANIISKVVGFKGKIKYDKSMPDGTPRKLLDTTRIKKFFSQEFISLEAGLENAYQDFLSQWKNLEN